MISTLLKRVREAVNSRLHHLGYSLTWMPPRVFAQPNQKIEIGFSLLAAHLMLTTVRPYFIGIGANDGVTHDPLYPFVRDFGWRGIMVEPIPEAFAALERNYAGLGGVLLVCAAAGRTDSRGTMYTVEGSDPQSMMMSLHSSFSRDMLLREGDGILAWKPASPSVKCRSCPSRRCLRKLVGTLLMFLKSIPKATTLKFSKALTSNVSLLN